MSRYLPIVLAFAVLFAVPQLAVAEDPLWTAVVELDEGGLVPQPIRVVAESEAACVSELALYRDALLVEPCQPVLEPSAITDDNDYPRSGARPRPRDDGAGGKGAGAGAGLGGLGHIGGG